MKTSGHVTVVDTVTRTLRVVTDDGTEFLVEKLPAQKFDRIVALAKAGLGRVDLTVSFEGAPAVPKQRRRSEQRCASCGGRELVDAVDNDGQHYLGCPRCSIQLPEGAR